MKEWLSGIIGESAANVVFFILLFALILLVIVVVFSLIKRLGGGSFNAGNRGRAPRLSVMDAAPVDSRRKLVLVRRDDVEHLLLIGGPTDVVVEQNIVIEPRASHRIDQTRIAPEHINRFKEYEATLAVEAPAEAAISRPAPIPLATPQQSPVESITLETPALQERTGERSEAKAEFKPVVMPAPRAAAPIEPARVEPAPVKRAQAPATPVASPAVSPTQAAPQARPASPVQTPVQAPSPRAASTQTAPAQTVAQVRTPAAPPSAPVVARAAPAYPPQPRTVLPAAPTNVEPSPRAHPAYPLGQVSRGVVSSTSSLAAVAAIESVSANLDDAIPMRADAKASIPHVQSSADLDIRPAPVLAAADTVSQRRLEPQLPFTQARTAEPSPSLDTPHDELAGSFLDSLQIDEPHEPATIDIDDLHVSFEDDLMNSLDKALIEDGEIQIENDQKADLDDVSIEDQMEKLLGELSRNPH